MTVGGAISAISTTWEFQIVGRALAGLGGIMLNVLILIVLISHKSQLEVQEKYLLQRQIHYVVLLCILDIHMIG